MPMAVTANTPSDRAAQILVRDALAANRKATLSAIAAFFAFTAEYKAGGRGAWFQFAKGLGHDDVAATAIANDGAVVSMAV